MDWSSVQLPEALRSRLAAANRISGVSDISFYEGFGSFHSENVEDLMNLSEAQYKPPACLPDFARHLLGNSQLDHLLVPSQTNGVSEPPLKRSREDHVGASAGSTDLSIADEDRQLISGVETIADAAEVTGNHSVSSEASAYRSETDGSSALSKCKVLARETVTPRNPAHCATRHLCAAQSQNAPAIQSDFGSSFRKEHFSIDPEMIFINHGAFGSALTGGVYIKRCYEAHMEHEVVQFVDRELLPLVVHSIRCLARFIHANPKQIVLLQNATFALNSAMRLITSEDVVAFLDTEYLAVYKMMWFRCREVGAPLHEIRISRYLHDDAVMGDDANLTKLIVSQLPEGCTTFVVDYVTSTSALCLPIFTHLIPALRQRGVQKIIVDAAHAPLQIDLNFDALSAESQPTVFVANLHKWFSSPKSAGFMWVNAGVSDDVHSVVLSHGAGDGLLSEFIWDGTRDYGAYLAIPAIVDFWCAQNCDRVREHCTSLLTEVVDMLTDSFHSRKVPRRAPFMSLVELPDDLQDDFVTAKYIQDVLHDTFKIEVPVKRIEGRYYLRVSVFVYNTPVEYVYLRDAILLVAEKWRNSDTLRTLREEKQRAESASATGGLSTPDKVPCDERIRRQGGCGVSALDPSVKRKRTAKFV